MFGLKFGKRNKVVAEPLSEGQLMYSTDSGELMVDLQETGDANVTRRVVRDPIAQQLEGQTILIL